MLVLALALWALLTAVGLGGFTLWVEDRYPSDHPNRAISPVAQRIISKRQVSVRHRFDTSYIYPSLSLEEILRRFSDARLNPTERRLFAYRLARADASPAVEAC